MTVAELKKELEYYDDDMEVVFNLDEIIDLLETEWGYEGIREDVRRLLIENGTPLPKGHGRLIDADELKTLSYEVFVDTDNPNRADGLSACNGIVEEDIDLAPTIIEADKAESDG